jgi:polyisoprenoid-binding protein YceI
VNLTAGSKFTAGGTLAPTLTSKYSPAKGKEFEAITLNGGSVSGKFRSVTGGFSADYAKETASTPYVGVVYGGGAPAPKVSKVTGGAGRATLKVSCSAGAICRYTATATVTEHLKGKKVLAVAASAKAKESATATKVLTSSSKSGSLKRGKSATVTLKLNKTGTALLKQFRKVKVSVAIKTGSKVISKATVTITEPRSDSKRRSIARS